MAISETVAEKTSQAGLLTADDLLRLHGEGVRGELIRGMLHETELPGFNHGQSVVDLGAFMCNFVRPRRSGTMAVNAGVWLESDPDTVRAPDIAFTSAERMSLDANIPGYSEIVPDLVVEVRSHTDSLLEIHDKARMWISHGVRLVWVVHPDTRTVDVHHAERTVTTLRGDDALDGDDVLRGFTFPLNTIFDW